MKNLFTIIYILICFILTSLIILQSKGTGLGKTFGGQGSNFSTKRGMERTIFILTIILALIFLVASLIQLIFF